MTGDLSLHTHKVEIIPSLRCWDVDELLTRRDYSSSSFKSRANQFLKRKLLAEIDLFESFFVFFCSLAVLNNFNGFVNWSTRVLNQNIITLMIDILYYEVVKNNISFFKLL